MPVPLEIAIAALNTMVAAVGSDAEFPGDAIWQHAPEEVESERRPSVFGPLIKKGYLEKTGRTTTAVTPDRRSSPATEYRFGPRLRPNLVETDSIARDMVGAFTAACEGILRLQHDEALRLVSSLLSKRFLILTGLSGSGKTKQAQAFARWISPPAAPIDAFSPGRAIPSAVATYHVKKSDTLAVEFWNSDDEATATKVTLPREMINEWASYIEANSIDKTAQARGIREAVKDQSQFSDQLHSFETHLKAAAFALLESRNESAPSQCYAVVPVGADWTGNDNILGYPDGLRSTLYIARPALELVLAAASAPDVPHFLILDEMNLSHVERYFADVLSLIESKEGLELYSGDLAKAEQWRRTATGRPVPPRLSQLPENLFIIGTVNVDETTYMFSPKVLDRANVIEFRMETTDVEAFLDAPLMADLKGLAGKGTSFGKAFVDAARSTVFAPPVVKARFDAEMLAFFRTLQERGAEFGYRTLYESARFVHFYGLLADSTSDDQWFTEAFDCVVSQKLLPKLHGSRAQLSPVLKRLWFLCVNNASARAANAAQDAGDTVAEPSISVPADAPYPISANKIARMWRLLMENGFVSFAEA